MMGAIAGDIIGSPYEFDPIKTTDFPLFSPPSRFTDDTVLTIATAEAILTGGDYTRLYQSYGRRYPDAGYGGSFIHWIYQAEPRPYNSWGNGSAMRVSPVGFAFNSIEEVLAEARISAAVTHDHPEGIKGAQATALAVYLARMGADKHAVSSEITAHFGYNLDRTLDQIRPGYVFNESCRQTVPEALIAFLESDSFEDAVRKAVSLGGDSDTLACITGAVAQAHYGVGPSIIAETRSRLPDDLLSILDRFAARFPAAAV